MADKLALLIWAATPDRPELVVTPLVHALAGRALDAEVEIHFAGPAVRWLVEGFADQRYASAEKDKSVGYFLREAQQEGVTLYACGMAAAQWVDAGEDLLAGSRHAGATAFVVRALDPEWRTLTY
ncbi:DsrE family protein [Dechloromonas sp. HYN0024]|uniref:DsrE family protein n=1 Tax=Dechloromonas sp. HYN0024 TaxID=2231055 RepID=UPI000E4366A6|nr:DsrE family protein [Dechloromonas sp. HYN0024]AXS78609.1 peroxiredoxin [Dechloromonas sp. HYN0024]